MTVEPPFEDDARLARLREELVRRNTRRYRRRRFRRWQRERLLIRLMAVERDLVDATEASRRGFIEQRRDRIVDRLDVNAQRLFR